jgi:hypothetical protein
MLSNTFCLGGAQFYSKPSASIFPWCSAVESVLEQPVSSLVLPGYRPAAAQSTGIDRGGECFPIDRWPPCLAPVGGNIPATPGSTVAVSHPVLSHHPPTAVEWILRVAVTCQAASGATGSDRYTALGLMRRIGCLRSRELLGEKLLSINSGSCQDSGWPRPPRQLRSRALSLRACSAACRGGRE